MENENLDHVFYALRRDEERLYREATPLTPWQPAGMLAVQVVCARPITHALRGVDAATGRPVPPPPSLARLLRRVERFQRSWGLKRLDARGDLQRLRAALQLPPAALRDIRPEDLEAMRYSVELLVLSYSERGRTEILEQASRFWLEPRPVWAGIAMGTADVFGVTPLVAVQLSAIYGLARGQLRLCPLCWSLFIAPPRHNAQACPRCRELRRAPRDRLAHWKQEAWRRMLHRMRTRGFARLERLRQGTAGNGDEPRWWMLGLFPPRMATRDVQAAWRAEALRMLYQVRSRAELQDWERAVVPPGRPGRPRKCGRTGHPAAEKEEVDSA